MWLSQRVSPDLDVEHYSPQRLRACSPSPDLAGDGGRVNHQRPVSSPVPPGVGPPMGARDVGLRASRCGLRGRRPTSQDCPVRARWPHRRLFTRHLSRKLAVGARCSAPVYRSGGVRGPALPADPGAESESMGWTVDDMSLLQEPAGVQGTAGGAGRVGSRAGSRCGGGSGVPASRVWGSSVPAVQAEHLLALSRPPGEPPCARAWGHSDAPDLQPGSCDPNPLSQKLTHMCTDL